MYGVRDLPCLCFPTMSLEWQKDFEGVVTNCDESCCLEDLKPKFDLLWRQSVKHPPKAHILKKVLEGCR